MQRRIANHAARALALTLVALTATATATACTPRIRREEVEPPPLAAPPGLATVATPEATRDITRWLETTRAAYAPAAWITGAGYARTRAEAATMARAEIARFFRVPPATRVPVEGVEISHDHKASDGTWAALATLSRPLALTLIDARLTDAAQHINLARTAAFDGDRFAELRALVVGAAAITDIDDLVTRRRVLTAEAPHLHCDPVAAQHELSARLAALPIAIHAHGFAAGPARTALRAALPSLGLTEGDPAVLTITATTNVSDVPRGDPRWLYREAHALIVVSDENGIRRAEQPVTCTAAGRDAEQALDKAERCLAPLVESALTSIFLASRTVTGNTH